VAIAAVIAVSTLILLPAAAVVSSGFYGHSDEPSATVDPDEPEDRAAQPGYWSEVEAFIEEQLADLPEESGDSDPDPIY
jgi:hypothetical protein